MLLQSFEEPGVLMEASGAADVGAADVVATDVEDI